MNNYFYAKGILCELQSERKVGWQKFYVINGAWYGWLSPDNDRVAICHTQEARLHGPDVRYADIEVLWMSPDLPQPDEFCNMELIEELLEHEEAREQCELSIIQ